MKTLLRLVAACLAALLLTTAPGLAQSAGGLLIPAGANWRYNDTGTDLGTSWRGLAYADGGWAVGPAEFGYGDGGEATVLSYGPNPSMKYPCYYFRHAFTVADPTIYESLSLDVLRDDGCVVYLNGQEVSRPGMPAGTISYATYASAATEYNWDRSISIPNLLQPGNNVVAVEVHQGNATSSDLSFNLELQGQYRVPTVTLVSPTDNAVLPDSQVQFTIQADDPTGLALATLVVSTAPQTLTFSGPAQTVDADIRQTEPDANFGPGLSVNVDGENPHTHAVLQFLGVVGSQPGQLPAGTQISSAVLRVYCTNPGNRLRIFQIIESWSEDEVSWNSRSSGQAWGDAGADGLNSHAAPEFPGDCSATGWRTVDVTGIVQAWSDGAANHGFVLLDSGTDGVDFESSESSTPPELVITYGGATVHSEQQVLAGTSATIQFNATLGDDSTYLWNCEVKNTAGLGMWAAANRRVTIDSHYPEIPVLVHPADGATATSLSPVLTVNVSDPDGDPLNVTFYGRGGNLSAEPFTLVFLPDTQKYVVSATYAPIFTKQTQWIVNQRDALDIVFVTHAGDICDTYNSVSEHDYAAQSLSLLDGVVPYGFLPGNHDQPTTLYNSYWPYTRYENETWYGGHYPANGNDNSYQLFSAGGVEFVIVHLQFWPGDAELNWADAVLKAHPYRRAIITTHGFLGLDGSRNVHVMGSTQYIWDRLVVPNDNVYFVLCGHVHGEMRRTDVVNGREVHQLLADYQTLSEGGQGWMRVMRFAPAENRVYVETFSPHLNGYQTDADSQFSLDFPMNGFTALGAVASVPSGTEAQFPWTNLLPITAYEWFTTAADLTGRTSLSPTWSFATGTGDMQPPILSDILASELTETTVRVTWNTDEPANSVVVHDSEVTEPITVTDAVLTTAHTVWLTNLQPGTTYTFSVSSRDASGNVRQLENLSFTTLPANLPPQANTQEIVLNEDEPAAILLAGSDPENDPLIFQISAQPTNGTVELADQRATYTPFAHFHGSDQFAFTVSDGRSVSVPAVVTLTVAAVNDSPLVQNESVETVENTALPITLAGADVDGDSLTFAILTGPQHGMLTGTTPDLVYTPTAGYFGPDSFTFTANDGTVDSAPATVQITVTEFDAPPVPASQNLQLAEDTALPLTLAASDPDTAAQDLVFSVVSGPASGVLSGTAPALTYTPNADFHGSDGFTFTVSDGTTVSAPAQVSLSVTPVNDAPVAQAQTLPTPEDTALAIMLGAADVDGDSLTFTVVGGPQRGTLSGTAPLFTYAPNADFNGTDEFAFTSSDGNAVSAPALVTVIVNPVNDPPVADAATVSVAEDGSLQITLTGSDRDSASISFQVSSGPAHGSFGGTAPNLTYTPSPDYFGPDSFTFTTFDGELSSAPAAVNVAVLPVNDPPVAVAGLDQAVVDADRDGTQTITLDGSASSDLDGTIVEYQWEEESQFLGTGALIRPSLSVGTHTVTLTVTDNNGATHTDTVVITVSPGLTEIEVFRDSFEVSEWNGLWTEDSQNDWYRSSQRATDGSRSAEVDGQASNASLTSVPIDLQGRGNARISFDWLIESGLDKGEYIDFQVSTNGGSTWTPVASLNGNVDPENQWRAVTFDLSGISQLQLRFRGKMSGADEDANVDNVRVIAH